MTVRQAVRLGLAAFCFALAAALALLATDLWRVSDRVAAADLRAAAGSADADAWEVEGRVPFSSAERILAVRDDVALRRALQLYLATREGGLRAGFGGEQARARGEAEAALSRVESSESDRRRASRAANLLGILAYQDTAPSEFRPAGPAENAVAAFQNAVRLDPQNDRAKTNLERLLRRLRVVGEREGEGSGLAGFGQTGANVSPPGSGY